MSLEKLAIRYEVEGSTLQFDNEHRIEAHFNPSRLAIAKTANWSSQNAAQRDSPELQFTGAEPATLSVELLFDTYDTPERAKRSVRKEYTDRLAHLATVERHGDKHRPPVCQILWGGAGAVFEGVLQSLELQFTLFMEDGTPVRATARCAFKQWRTNEADLRRQDKQSADLDKVHVLKRGESLATIAAREYLDAGMWRPIARANGIDDPLGVVPGTLLRIPRLAGG